MVVVLCLCFELLEEVVAVMTGGKLILVFVLVAVGVIVIVVPLAFEV